MSDWKCFEGCPSYSALKTRPNAPPKPGSKRRTFAEEARSLQKWPKVEVVDAEKRKCLLDLFRKRFAHVGGGVYKRVDLSSVKFSARNNCYYAQLSGEGESFCLNVGRSHRSNRIYGVVDHHSAYLKCHCSCATTEGRVSGKMCRDFRSPPVTLTRHDMAVLFGGEGGGGGKGAASAVSGESTSPTCPARCTRPTRWRRSRTGRREELGGTCGGDHVLEESLPCCFFLLLGRGGDSRKKMSE